MAAYSVLFRKSVRRDLGPVPKKDVKRIMDRIKSLADDPRPPGCEKLSAGERYRVFDKAIIVSSIQSKITTAPYGLSRSATGASCTDDTVRPRRGSTLDT